MNILFEMLVKLVYFSDKPLIIINAHIAYIWFILDYYLFFLTLYDLCLRMAIL